MWWQDFHTALTYSRNSFTLSLNEQEFSAPPCMCSYGPYLYMYLYILVAGSSSLTCTFEQTVTVACQYKPSVVLIMKRYHISHLIQSAVWLTAHTSTHSLPLPVNAPLTAVLKCHIYLWFFWYFQSAFVESVSHRLLLLLTGSFFVFELKIFDTFMNGRLLFPFLFLLARSLISQSLTCVQAEIPYSVLCKPFEPLLISLHFASEVPDFKFNSCKSSRATVFQEIVFLRSFKVFLWIFQSSSCTWPFSEQWYLFLLNHLTLT